MEEEWQSQNGIWRIHRPKVGYGKWQVESTTGVCDWPIHYRDVGGVAFDYPEQIPEYVKRQFRKMSAAHEATSND